MLINETAVDHTCEHQRAQRCGQHEGKFYARNCNVWRRRRSDRERAGREIIEPTDAVATVTRACICGGDRGPYNKLEHTD